jgi:hypothetical protein
LGVGQIYQCFHLWPLDLGSLLERPFYSEVIKGTCHIFPWYLYSFIFNIYNFDLLGLFPGLLSEVGIQFNVFPNDYPVLNFLRICFYHMLNFCLWLCFCSFSSVPFVCLASITLFKLYCYWQTVFLEDLAPGVLGGRIQAEPVDGVR